VKSWSYTLDELAQAVGAPSPGVRKVFSAVSTDTRTLEAGQVFFALSGDNFDGNTFVDVALERGAVAAVSTAPSGRGPCIVVDDPLKALQDFAAWHRNRFSIPIIAITGSCGKTSSKDMIAAVLSGHMNVLKTEGNLNNHIGVPLTLLRLEQGVEALILEMGANHVGEIAALCRIARPTESTITMIGAAHLEGFGTIEDVARAKSEIIEGLDRDGVFYVNVDDSRCVAAAERFPGKKIRFGSHGDVAVRSCKSLDTGEMAIEIDPVGTLRLPLVVRAHAHNVALAVAVGLQHGVTVFEEPLREACSRATRFKVLPVGPLTIFDDTYNANPSSVRASLQALAEFPARGRRVAALGDMLELGPEAHALHADIGAYAAKLGIDRLYLRGEFAQAIAKAARDAGVQSVTVIQDHDAMATAIASEAGEGDVVLAKGSRRMRMEKVVEALRARYRNTAEAGAMNGAG